MPGSRARVADAGIVSLAAMRIGIGALAWVRPEAAATLFGLRPPDGQARYLWRLFGVRDVLVGLGTVASTGPRRRTWAGVGLACDVADGAAGALSRRDVTSTSAAAMIGVPAAAVAFGGWALGRRS
ncbi:hypothetical protein FHR72_003050 [Mycolicibacterium iranicum]|uniref:DUF4267 domain-containing protein n=1 Tax=Mycolicibacterium iranicum TaxID=912594 RepID=A0A839QAT0_MYCIR|nr:DUF4267 domain-containing protein [Mycolicibacterium iranicum]MBB2991565.1 hypothetical protein [Mycolicibacterium iranicum]